MAGVSPYQTALELKRPTPDWIPNKDDKDRVQAYNTYWDVFMNVKEAFKVVLRDPEGDEISQRFIPAARTIVEATNRYLAKNPIVTPLQLAVDAQGNAIQADEAITAQLMRLINDFFKREEFFTKFSSLKRWLLVRGDAVLHLTADDTKAEGQKLRLVELDPATYFRIEDPLDTERTIGVYIVTLVEDDAGEIIAQRQEYRKTANGTVFTRLAFFEKDKWDDRPGIDPADPLTQPDATLLAAANLEFTPVDVPSRFAGMEALLEGYDLPDQITSIPVYLYRNRRQGNLPYGLSELQGIETILAGIIQTATDEDITMAQTGIGVYVTTSGKPRDAQGKEIEWMIAPASVIELESENDKFERVQGVDSVQPMLDHMNMLKGQAQETTGTPEIAVGSVEVKVAESGIALALQMNPILAKNEETEQELKSRTEQLLFDIINMWLPAFESFTPNGVELSLTFDDPLPKDRAAILKEILDMLTAKAISIAFSQKLLKEKLGYDIPADMLTEMAAENQTLLDSVGGRINEEAGGGPSTPAAPGVN